MTTAAATASPDAASAPAVTTRGRRRARAAVRMPPRRIGVSSQQYDTSVIVNASARHSVMRSHSGTATSRHSTNTGQW